MFRKLIVIFALVGVINPATSFSQSRIEKKIKLRGTPNFIKVDLNSTRKVLLWGVSAGNMSAKMEVYGRIPEGAKISAKAAFVQKNYEKTITDKKFHYDVDLINSTQLSKRHSQCLPISVEESDAGVSLENYPAISDPVCDAVGNETMEIMAESLSQAYGGNWGIGNACAYFVESIGGSPEYGNICDYISEEELAQYGLQCIDDETSPNGDILPMSAKVPRKIVKREASLQTIQLYGLLNKDACIASKKPEYLFMLEVDLSKLNASDYPNGVEMSLNVKELKVSKGKEAAIKPESEGRYQPKPIVMMNWLGETCGNKIDVISWKKYKPASVRPLTVYGLLSYKGLVLNLALVDRVLTGGQATFELSTRREAYGVCFNLQRKRQNKNGYPR